MSIVVWCAESGGVDCHRRPFTYSASASLAALKARRRSRNLDRKP